MKTKSLWVQLLDWTPATKDDATNKKKKKWKRNTWNEWNGNHDILKNVWSSHNTGPLSLMVKTTRGNNFICYFNYDINTLLLNIENGFLLLSILLKFVLMVSQCLEYLLETLDNKLTFISNGNEMLTFSKSFYFFFYFKCAQFIGIDDNLNVVHLVCFFYQWQWLKIFISLLKCIELCTQQNQKWE